MQDFILASGGVKARELLATEVVAAESADSQIPTEVFVGRGAGQDPANRKKLDTLVLAARAGKIARLKLANVAFTSDDPDNSNSFEFPPEEFESFVASFAEQPFQRDHSDLQADRGGTVLRAWAEQPDATGRRWGRAEIELTEPWAIAGALNGTIDRFSFGAKVSEQLCSVCAKDFFACRAHELGKSYEGKRARLLCKGAKGDEISAVVKPAYAGTGVGAIAVDASGRRRTLDIAAMRGETEKEIKAMDLKTIAKLVGLSEDATEEQVTEAIAKKFAEPAPIGEASTVPPVITSLLDLPATASVSEVSAEIMARTYRPDADVDKAAIAELKAGRRVEFWSKEKGKFTPADQEWAMNYALKDPKGFELYASKKEPAVPLADAPGTAITAGDVSTGTHAEDAEEFGEGLTAKDEPLTDLERKFLRQSKGYVKFESYLKARREDARAQRAQA